MVEQFRTVAGSGPRICDHIVSCSTLQKLGAESDEIMEPGFRATSVVRVPTSTHIIFYVHGGGFVSGSSIASGKYLLQLFLELQHRGVVCNIISVDYDLSPSAPYPTALRQVISAYRYAANQGKKIILMGDSAGGNLCLGLLQHLTVPNPLLEAPATKVGNDDIVAMCLLSPWVNLRTEGPSVNEYKYFDCLDKAVLDAWAKHYLGPQDTLDCYSSPIKREKHWGKVLPAKSMILAGGMELFLSDIIRLSDKIRAEKEDALDLIVAPRKGHAWAALDYGFHYGTKSLGVVEDRKSGRSGLTGLKLQADWVAKAVLA